MHNATVDDRVFECVANEWLGEDIVLLTVRPETGAWPAVAPGQFFMLAPPDGDRVFVLRRPFSLHDLTPPLGRFLFRRLGYGTRRLADMVPGTRLRALGPLGRPFPMPPEPTGPVLLISGGLGMATMFMLHRELVRRGYTVHHVYAARTATHIVRLDALRALGGYVWPATDDGSMGWAGRIDRVLERRPDALQTAWTAIYMCGPTVMMRACAPIVRRFWSCPVWVALEVVMGCGFGVCRGCAIPLRDSNRYAMACIDGPIFSIDEVDWSCLPPP